MPFDDTHRHKLNPVKEFLKIKSWLSLIFSRYLQTQLKFILSYSDPHFPAFSLNSRDTPYISVFSPNVENNDQNNNEYGHFLQSVGYKVLWFNWEYRCLNKVIDQIDRKVMAGSFKNFYRKMWDSLCLNTGKHLLVEVLL